MRVDHGHYTPHITDVVVQLIEKLSVYDVHKFIHHNRHVSVEVVEFHGTLIPFSYLTGLSVKYRIRKTSLFLLKKVAKQCQFNRENGTLYSTGTTINDLGKERRKFST